MAYTISTGTGRQLWETRLANRGISVFNENSKPAESVEAGGPLEASTLGATIPFVVGTGQVDGKFFIGGTTVISTITGYETGGEETEQRPYSYSSGSSGSSGTQYKVSAPSYGLRPLHEVDSDVVRTPITTTETVASCGYILAYDPFERGYDLIRLEVDGDVVYDTENGIGAGITFRFYGGRHTAVDPILTDIIGANAGAYQNFVMVFLDGYPSDTPPSLRAVISNAATDQLENEEIAWTGTAPSSMVDGDEQAAYDPVDGVIYQLLMDTEIAGLTEIQLAVLDVNTHTERYRIPLADSSSYVSGGAWAIAMRGTGHVLVRMATPAEPESPTRIYNATTGQIVAEWREAADETIVWLSAMPFGGKWLFIGDDLELSGGLGSVFAVADLAAGTLEVTSDTVGISPTVHCRGRTLSGTCSFFVLSNNAVDVYEFVFDGDNWSSSVVYTGSGIIGLEYDTQTGFLVSSESVSGTSSIKFVNPDTGAIIDSISVASPLFTINGVFHQQRVFADPGTVLFHKGAEEVWAVNVAARSASLYIDVAAITGQAVVKGIYDQARRSFFSAYGDTKWTEYKLPNSAPGLIDLPIIITDVMSLAGFSSADLAFESFTGL